jgi:hypothetical protein
MKNAERFSNQTNEKISVICVAVYFYMADVFLSERIFPDTEVDKSLFRGRELHFPFSPYTIE